MISASESVWSPAYVTRSGLLRPRWRASLGWLLRRGRGCPVTEAFADPEPRQPVRGALSRTGRGVGPQRAGSALTAPDPQRRRNTFPLLRGFALGLSVVLAMATALPSEWNSLDQSTYPLRLRPIGKAESSSQLASLALL